jgi:hypothetical protein
VYIAQTEPVKTTSGLSLSQSSELVEYFLVRDEESNTENTNFVFIPLYLIILIISRKIKNIK